MLLADYFDTSIDYLVGATANRRRIEPFEEYGLGKEEIAVIEKLRQLSAKQRKCVAMFLEALL